MVSLLSTSRVMVFPVRVFTKICIFYSPLPPSRYGSGDWRAPNSNCVRIKRKSNPKNSCFLYSGYADL